MNKKYIIILYLIQLKMAEIKKDNKTIQVITSHKKSLEEILSSIKKCQLNILSKSETTKDNIKNTKQILFLLKEKLNNILSEKNKLHGILKLRNETKKIEIQKKVFTKPEEKAKNIDCSDINQLKMLNFQIENIIKKNDFLISQKSWNY